MIDALFLIVFLAYTDIWMNLWIQRAMGRKAKVSAGQISWSLAVAFLLFLTVLVHPAVTAVLLAGIYLLAYTNLLHIRFFGSLLGYGQLKQFLGSFDQLKNNKVVLRTGAANLRRKNDLGVLLLWLLNTGFAWWPSFELQGVELWGLLLLGGLLLAWSVWSLVNARKQRKTAYLYFERLGLLGYYAAAAEINARPAREERIGEDPVDAEEIRSENDRARQHPLYGRYRGKNLIFIQLESFQQFLLDRKTVGQEITPFLNRLKQQSISFENIHAQYAMGHTADVELVALNSLYPMRHEVVNFTHYDKTYRALPHLLKEQGYASAAFHGHTGEYYNRVIMFQTYGFDHFFAEDHYQVTERIGLGFPDRPFLLQSADKIAQMARPFFSHLITLTSHFPFEIDQRGLPDDPDLSPMLNNYFQSVHYTDQALAAFFDRLERDGTLDDTVVVLFGDHEGVPLQHVDELIAWLGRDPSQRAYHDFDLRKVPFLICAGEAGSLTPQTITTAGSTLDLLPTVQSLFGIERTKVQYGCNLFVKEDDFVISRVYPDGTFASEEYVYLADVTETFEQGTLYDRKTQRPLPFDHTHESYELFVKAKRTVASSDAVIRNDRMRRADGISAGSPPQFEFELSPELSECLPLMERDAIILPYTYAFEQIQKEAQELTGEATWQEPIWDAFYEQHRVRLAYLHQLDLEANGRPIYFQDSVYLPFLSEAGYELEVVKGQTIFDLIESVDRYSLIILAVKDEGSQALSPKLRLRLSDIQIKELNPSRLRWSYLNVILKTNRLDSLDERAADELLELDVAKGSKIDGFTMPFDLSVKSAGASHGNLSSIRIDGREYAQNHRGINIVVYSLTEKQVVQSTFVDTFNTLYARQTVYVARKHERG